MLVKDINPGSEDSVPSALGVVGETLFFSAADPVSGRELWKTDGTETGTVLVKDINVGTEEGSEDSFLESLGVVGDTLVFLGE